ncbi:U-box domain-containing protein 35-like isoform X2 [Nymphaea colorata]|uniref:U-box domain-containing protein 35-like isoform X2 n=1 Tax=Nymphaea colorata TaxID=210225 RepID=UPI00129EF6B6|nr:U-box domain-containing protein 35-like isoform X2 [Nymphaea colorata]
MWRGNYGVNVQGGGVAGRDCPSPTQQPQQLVAVAVDNDKNSQQALKWAADHLVAKGQLFLLLHVRKKITTIATPSGHDVPITDVDEEIASAFYSKADAQLEQMLLPFRFFCSRRGLLCKEVILEDTDISKAIVDYAFHGYIDKLVLGVSSRSLFRPFRQTDVPTAVSRAAPDFCTIYVIAKGKVSTVRPAPHPIRHPVNRALSINLEAENYVLPSPKSQPFHIPADGLDLELVRRHKLQADHAAPDNIARCNPRLERVSGSHKPILNYDQLQGSNINFGTGISPRSRGNAYLERQPTNVHYHPLHANRLNPQPSCLREDSCSTQSSSLRSFDIGRDIEGPNYWRNNSSNDYGGGALGNSAASSPGSGGYDWRNNSLRSQESDAYGFSKNSLLVSSEAPGDNWSKNSLVSDGSTEFTRSSMVSNESSTESWSKESMQDDVETEMQRLRLEIQQRMDMYNSVCKEAISARQKAKDLRSCKGKEESMIDDAKMVEEAAIEIVKKEKQRCRVTLEDAGVAKKAVDADDGKRQDTERKVMKKGADQRKKSWDQNILDLAYRRYRIEELEKATENFSVSLKIGEGGYGPVFRAMLDHTWVAIKALRPDASQGKQQFQKEIEILSRIRHPNMVLLLGACPEYGCLVYEYMANGSLEDCLFKKNDNPPLTWQQRFKIAAEIATGLLFLHQTKPEPLVHRDLKPANILLDHNFVGKISDVGLARLVPPSVADDVTQYRMTAAAGTFCYIDPEYQKTGMVGIKSDVYALGIILLQLITARPPMGLAHNVEWAIEKGMFAEMLDPAVPDWPMEETMSFAKMALKCAELRRKDRPDLGTVVLPELNQLRDLGNRCSQLMEPGSQFRQSRSPSFQLSTLDDGDT